MEAFFKIVQSHMYEMYAVLAGTITLLIMNVVKIPIKRRNYMSVYSVEAGADDEVTAKKKRILYQRKNFIIIIITCVMGIVVFFCCAQVSPQISFQFGSAVLSGLIALAEYAVLQQIIT